MESMSQKQVISVPGCHTAPNSSLRNPIVHKSQISKSVKVSLSNCDHHKKTTPEEFQLSCVPQCILWSPVCHNEHCLIFKGSHLPAILFDKLVLKNYSFLAVELENEIIRFTHWSFSVPTLMKHCFLDRFVSWQVCDVTLNRLVSQTIQCASDPIRI